MTREERRLRSVLRRHCHDVRVFLFGLDGVMRKPESFERGRKVAALANALELANDRVRHFVLGQKL